MRQHNNVAQGRSEKGNILVLILAIVVGVIVPIGLLIAQLGPYLLFCGRAQNVIDAAGLIASSSLSKVVINDPNFGYVSLSNHAPVGTGTVAGDGEPLPVTSINTLVGTLRQNALVADQLQNDKMNELLDQDLSSLKTTIKSLNRSLKDALNEAGAKVVDLNAKSVTPVADVKAFLTQNLPPNLKLESIKLSSGWLEGGSETTVDVPQPAEIAHLGNADISNGKYPAFTNLPVGQHQFTFAGLGAQSHQVSARNFREADDKHICSIVKIECTLVSNDAQHTKSDYVVCCQPFTAQDQGTRGAMTLRFVGSPELGGKTWVNFLSKGFFQDNKISNFEITDGDYPFDKYSRMRPSSENLKSSTSEEFSEHLYFWLRNAHLRPHYSAVMAMLNEPFGSTANQVYTYQLNDDGTIARNVFEGTRFTRSVSADGQVAAMADTHIANGSNAIIFFRDNVRRQGSHSGKHAGQALAEFPLSGLDSWVDQNQLVGNFSKRGSNSNGLALDIEIGGNTSTAKRDVLSVRQRTASRKV